MPPSRRRTCGTLRRRPPDVPAVPDAKSPLGRRGAGGPLVGEQGHHLVADLDVFDLRADGPDAAGAIAAASREVLGFTFLLNSKIALKI